MATSIEKAQQRVKDLEDKLKQAKAVKQKAEARIKTAEAKQKRADDTRRKVLIGAMMLDHMEKNEATKTSVMGKLNEFLTRPDDRNLFGLIQAAEQAQDE